MDDEILVKDEPLASKMRPECLEDIVGQEHILGKGKLLYRAIIADKLGSIILYGPPGTGKTSIASVIAKTTNSQFRKINATTSGKKDMEEIIEDAKDDLYMYGKKTILFIDEIHRFNKAQQDYLLPFIEKGIITLIGATTENPFFEINKAILSRSQVFELQPLDQKAIQKIILKAISDKKNGYGNLKINLDQEALEFLSNCSVGDARTALNAIELAVKTTEKEDDVIHITIDVIQDCIQKKIVRYDNNDNHYDTISAFIKSMRGSDPDAAVYYLGKMLYAGEDIKFIARRIMICASEDVGNADPMALVVATNACLAVERVGIAEGRIILAQAVTYIATAPKSNSAIKAIDKVMNLLEKGDSSKIPDYLKDAHYPGAKELKHGTEYKYPHNYPMNYIKQEYLPKELQGEKFYEISDNGYEKTIKNHMRQLEEKENGNE